MKIEKRNDGTVEISGYVNVVERQSKVLMDAKGKFVETVKTGTFQRALDNAENVKMLLNHNVSHELAQTKDQSLVLNEDKVGLYARAVVSDAEVIDAVDNGTITGWSFGFMDNDISIEEVEGMNHRTLTDIELLEVSLLTLEPAYIATSVQVRAENVEKRYMDDVIDKKKNDDNKQEQKKNTNNYRATFTTFVQNVRK